jgi:CubicO group peptidase (beta-lactamase class C family)
MPPSNPAAGNQLAMSARALIALAQLHLNDGLAPNGTRLLSTANAQAMRQRHVDDSAAVGASNPHGLGWILPNRRGVAEHGGDTIGVASLLRMAPEQGVAVAVLINGGATGTLIDTFIEPLFSELAGIDPAPALPSPQLGTRLPDPRRYLGRYQSRQTLHEITLDEDNRLWLTAFPRAEALTMAETAGISTEPQRHELRPISGDNFVLTDASGAPIHAVEFLGTDATGRAGFLHTGRAIPRFD